MLETKVYLIKSDNETECHCGHHIKKGEEYYMLRTNAPKWLTLCKSCVKLLGTPHQVCMKELVNLYFETRPPDGKGDDRKTRKFTILSQEKIDRRKQLKEQKRIDRELKIIEL